MDSGRIATYIAGPLALATIVATLWLRSQPDAKKHKFGYILIVFWVLAPPVWFWVEWVFLNDPQDEPKTGLLKHTHELARNIWVALVIVLTAILGIKWPR